MRYRSRAMEMAHRERLAMIERGMTPPADLGAVYQRANKAARGSTAMSLGIVIMGLGFALALLIGFASREPEIAIGVGGAIAVVGLAFIVTSIVVHGAAKAKDDFYTTPRPVFDRPTPPPERRDPPSL